MSNAVDAINNETIESIPFDVNNPQDEKKSPGITSEIAAQTHFNEMRSALMEVAKAEAQNSQKVTRPKGKNSMITTFKIMKIVMETLRKTSDSGKEMNKQLKKEWKAVSDKQAKNNEESYGTANSNQWYLIAGQAAGFSHHIANYAFMLEMHGPIGRASSCIAHYFHPNIMALTPQARGKVTNWTVVNWTLKSLASLSECCESEESRKGFVSALEKISPQLSQMGNSYAQSMTSAEQYKLNTKESIFQHEVQTHTSEYQNGSQQQTSDKQAVDNAADTAKQLIRVQGEILMGKTA